MPELLKDICLLATDHHVCKAYVAKIASMGLQVNRVLLFTREPKTNRPKPWSRLRSRIGRRIKETFQKTSSHPSLPANETLAVQGLWRDRWRSHCSSQQLMCPDFQIGLNDLLAGIPLKRVSASSINAPAVRDAIANTPEQFVLFCGGGILRTSLLDLPKRFIHVHPGIVPDVKGADCILWSSLMRGAVGMSAFFMNSGIDTGDVLQTQEFPVTPIFGKNDTVPHDVLFDLQARFLIDYVDPVYRAHLLGSLLEAEPCPSKWEHQVQDPTHGQVFYFMHRRLKSLAVKPWNSNSLIDG